MVGMHLRRPHCIRRRLCEAHSRYQNWTNCTLTVIDMMMSVLLVLAVRPAKRHYRNARGKQPARCMHARNNLSSIESNIWEVRSMRPVTLYTRIVGASVTVLALLIPCFEATPATKTNFSGTWEMDTTRSESAHSGAPGPVTLVIKQTPTEVSIETRRSGQSETLIYKLDGSETKKPAQDNGPFEWRARWQGPKLVTEIHRNVNRATVTIEETFILDPKAKELTVDRTLTVQHGYSMRGAKNYSSGKDVFIKARGMGPALPLP